MIDPRNENLRLLTQASSDVPGNPSYCTLVRWALRGRRGIRLETVMIGGRRYTSREAIDRFISRTNEPGAVTDSAVSSQRAREQEAVERRLDAEGIGGKSRR